MKPTSSRFVSVGLDLAHRSASCSTCFDQLPLVRAAIRRPQPFSVGRRYRKGGVAIVGINPGASMHGLYKERRKRALEKFDKGHDSALVDHWNALATDAENHWNLLYLARIKSLQLALDALLVGNVALCATDGDNYPRRMLRNCWALHTASVLQTFAPGTVLFMGSSAVMDTFVHSTKEALPDSCILRMAHYAHREGHAHEVTECNRVLKAMAQA